MNTQREVIYSQRSEVLEGKDLKDNIISMTKEVIKNAVQMHLKNADDSIEKEVKKLVAYLDEICVPEELVDVKELCELSDEEITEKLTNIALDIYEKKEKEFTPEKMRELERVILLRTVDSRWMDHIDNMDHLKQGMGLRAFKQQDPVQAYQMEGSAMFEEMIEGIKVDTVKYMFHVQMQKAPERERVAKESAAVHPGGDGSSEEVKRKPVVKEVEIGRNDLCPCGSGKKYKNCCGRQV